MDTKDTPATLDQAAKLTVATAVVTTQAGNIVAAPKTTEEQERVSAGQRNINLIWERTQRSVALAVIGSALAVSTTLAIAGKRLGSPDIQLAAVVFIFGVANLVTGFYFGRTEHQRVAGVEQGR